MSVVSLCTDRKRGRYKRQIRTISFAISHGLEQNGEDQMNRQSDKRRGTAKNWQEKDHKHYNQIQEENQLDPTKS